MTENERPALILASSSPRRRELLTEANYRFEVVPPSDAAECGLCSGESPEAFVARLARQKGADVVHRLWNEGRRDGIVVACDTIAECQGQMLGKPVDETHARRMLELLRSREHRVFSGLCLWPLSHAEPQVAVDVTVLKMDNLPDEAIEDYLASGAWEGKAGGFGYQDRLGWIHIVQGSESNVVGLPMELLERMLNQVSGQ